MNKKTSLKTKVGKVKVGKDLIIEPKKIYSKKVTAKGNKAIIEFYKKFIGEEVIVIIPKKCTKKRQTKKEMFEQLAEFTDPNHGM
jgi:putative transposon-encoded protein